MNPTPTLSDEQIRYGNALRSADLKAVGIVTHNLLTDSDRDDVSKRYKTEANNFKDFLFGQGQPNPPSTALGMRIRRDRLVRLLKHFRDENQCLLQTNCFGFTRPVKEGGRLVLLSRGSFWQRSANASIEEIFGRFYTTTNMEGQIEYPVYMDLNLNEPRKNSTAQRYIKNFLAIYPKDEVDSVVHGYLFPIHAMLSLLESPAALGGETYLRITWGLVSYYEPGKKPGNMSLVIQANDPTQNGFVIEFRDTRIDPTENECPPRVPCNT